MQRRLELNFNPSSSIGSLTSVSALDNIPLPRHRWYYFKEAFSPELVQHAINDSNLEPKDSVIDPFSGSGTVALEAMLLGKNVLGYEVNPFLGFVSRTKLYQTRPQTIKQHLPDVLEAIYRGQVSSLENFSTFSEPSGGEKWLFNIEVIRAFEGGWLSTEKIYSPAKDMIRLALIGAAMDVSNATKDGKALRYRADWQKCNYGKNDFISSFLSRINQIIEDLESTPTNPTNAIVKTGDARKLLRDSDTAKFSLCVTSPPYLNSFDYTDVYRPELFLGRFVRSNEELQQLRHQTVRSHVQVKWTQPTETYFGSHFSESYDAINANRDQLWNNNIPEMIRAYFEDMKNVLTLLKSRALPDASLWIVVSTSAYAGVEIPVDLIIADIGTQVGWYLREVSVFRYLKRISGQQWVALSEKKTRPHLRESIIILDANPKRR